MNAIRSSLLAASFGFLLLLRVGVAQEPPQTLRVLCYNLHHGEGSDGVVDLARQAEVILSARPDLVALQEIDDRTQRTGRVDQTAELATLTGMHGRFVHQLDYEGGRYGQAILSRHPLSDVTVHWLPGTPERERRIAGSVNVRVHGHLMTFVTTHLHHNNEEFRQGQAQQLNQLFAQSATEDNRIVILAGDLNAVPDSRPLTILGEHWTSATQGRTNFLTYPAEKPERQLDYLLFRPAGRLKVVSAEVLEQPAASDHRPILVEFLIVGTAP